MSDRPLHERIDVGGMMMPSWRDVGTRDHLLTDAERRALAMTGELASLCRSIISDGPTAAQDWNEMALRIHAVQHMLMAQAAARAYPQEFRLLGFYHEPSI